MRYLQDQNDTIYVTVNNGIEENQHLLTGTPLLLEDYYTSHYVSVQLSHPGIGNKLPFHEYGFFTNSDNAQVVVGLTAENKPYLTEAKNIVPFEEMGSQKIKEHTDRSFHDFWDYYNKNVAHLGQNDSITAEAFELNKQHALKVLEAIQLNKPSYFSFWTFRRVISNHPDISRTVKEELLSTKFHSYKGTYEYELVRDLIFGSEIQIGEVINEFESTDFMTNKVVRTAALKRPLLIMTWATWCSPCIRKMEILKDISLEYPKLNLLLINFDDTIDKATKMVINRGFKGHHLSHLAEGVPPMLLNQVIGKVYLIDGKSQVQYNIDLTPDPDFKLLQEKLAEL